NDVWAVGTTQLSNGNFGTLTEHWNGTKWSIVPSPNNSFYTFNELLAVSAISTSNVWAVGDIAGPDPDSDTFTLIEHWNGSQWSAVSSPPLPNTIGLVGVAAVSANNAWAVGSNRGPVLIEHWNGSSWKIVASPPITGTTDFLNAVARVPATSMVWAV